MITGIISGLGAIAGTNMLGELNKEVTRRVGHGVSDSDFPEVVLHQIPFQTSNQLGHVDEQVFKESISRSVSIFQAAEVSQVVLACNTLDRLAKSLVETTGGLKYLSIRATLRQAILESSSKNFLFLGSEMLTQEMDFNSFPNKHFYLPDQRDVNYLIQKGIEGISDWTTFKNIVGQHPEATVVLGCTELYPYHTYPHAIESITAFAERATL